MAGIAPGRPVRGWRGSGSNRSRRRSDERPLPGGVPWDGAAGVGRPGGARRREAGRTRRPRPGLSVGRTGRPRACPRTDRPVMGVTSGPRARLRPTTPAGGKPRRRARSGSPPIRDEAAIRRRRRGSRPRRRSARRCGVRAGREDGRSRRSGRPRREERLPCPAIHARGSGARTADCRRSAISLFR
jgi:hypothetical protein